MPVEGLEGMPAVYVGQKMQDIRSDKMSMLTTDGLPGASAAMGRADGRVTIEGVVSGTRNSGADGGGGAGMGGTGRGPIADGPASSRLRKLVRNPKVLLDEVGGGAGVCATPEVLLCIVGGWEAFDELGRVVRDLEE